MARVYRIANDMAEKEKAVGGLLTLVKLVGSPPALS